MDDSDFHRLARNLGKSHRKANEELVQLVRSSFPAAGVARWDHLIAQLGVLNTAGSFQALPALTDSGRKATIDQRLSEVQRGNDPRFRALLLKWLWKRDGEFARDTFLRWNSAISEAASQAVGQNLPRAVSVWRSGDIEARREARARIYKAVQLQATHLDLSGLDITYVPEEVSRIEKLAHLGLARTKIEALASLAACPPLKTLDLSHTPLKKLYAPPSCRTVTEITALDSALIDLEGAASFPALENLYVWHNTFFASIEGIEDNENLKELAIHHSPRVQNIYPLTRLRNLQRLEITYTDVKSLAGLENSTALRILGCGGGPLETLNGVEFCTGLLHFTMRYATPESLHPLAQCAKLATVDLFRVDLVDDQRALWLKRNLVSVELKHCRIGGIPVDDLARDDSGNCLKSLRDHFFDGRTRH